MNAARECLLPTAYSYITRSFSAYIAIIIAIILARPFTSLSRTVIIMVSLVEIIIALFATFGQLALGKLKCTFLTISYIPAAGNYDELGIMCIGYCR